MTDTLTDNSNEKKPVIIKSKVKDALRVLGINKSPGVDGIQIELFQASDTEFVKMLPKIHQQIWKTRQWPTVWKCSMYIPVFKKEMLTSADYRTTALISHKKTNAQGDATKATLYEERKGCSSWTQKTKRHSGLIVSICWILDGSKK